jgi:ABC-type polysaccharide/polyol phosphate export permease
MLRNLWRYRSFVLGMASREFRARYLGSVLGSVWAVIHPLTLVFIYTVIFGQLMKSRVPGVEDGLGYGIFLCYTCTQCHKRKMAGYRADIHERYDTDEQIEPDE